jgi:hypothetical protein
VDKAHEFRNLSSEELQLKKLLKTRVLGLAAIERSRAKQKSRLTWIREGDANTRFFHAMASSRRRNNHIALLTNGSEVATTQSDKHQLIFQHFQNHIGSCPPRSLGINFTELGWLPQQLHHLELPFTEQEVDKTIKSLPKQKSPGPNGYIGIFFKTCWNIIKDDIMAALQQFYDMNQQDLHFLNQALMMLIPKKENAVRVSDFRPISLIHSFAKLVSKLLANRLAPELSKMISYNQNSFIKKRCIHDNFLFVQQVIKDLHSKMVPALFIKLDISKAFDSVNWSYLLDIMSYLGFGLRWRNWILALWATSSSSFLLNGEPDLRIRHKRGVRQGDPPSPLLFLLAIEPLHLLFYKAQSMGAIEFLHHNCTNFRLSLYVDATAVFINATLHDLQATKYIMHLFANATGLSANMDKTELYPIQCQDMDIQGLLGPNQSFSSFPCSYLGLPLHFKSLPKSAMFPLIQRIGNRLPGWKRNMLAYPGREVLVKYVLSAMPTHFLTIYKLPRWAEKEIDRYRRSFLWRGEEPDKVKGDTAW